MFRKIFYGISLLTLLVIAGGYGFLRTKLPQRSGGIKLSGLKSKVDVVFDKIKPLSTLPENHADKLSISIGFREIKNHN